MRFLIMTVILMTGMISQAAVPDLGKEIAEASVSEKILRKRLLRILQNSEVSIAANEKQELNERNVPSQDFEVKLVKTH